MAILGLVILLSSAKFSFTSSEVLLLLLVVIVDHTDSSSWINCLALGIELAMLSDFFASDAVYPVDGELFFWCAFFVFLSFHILRLFYSSKPWLNCCELITLTRRNDDKECRHIGIIVVMLVVAESSKSLFSFFGSLGSISELIGLIALVTSGWRFFNNLLCWCVCHIQKV